MTSSARCRSDRVDLRSPARPLSRWTRRSAADLFTHERPGYKEKPFTLRKPRTTRAAKDGKEVYFRIDAERLTPLGRFLRRTSIDELPEFWHVVTREMSLVGPRLHHIEYLPKYTAKQSHRHDVRPGITGWAAVYGGQLISFSKRLEFDVWDVDKLELGC